MTIIHLVDQGKGKAGQQEKKKEKVDSPERRGGQQEHLFGTSPLLISHCILVL